MKNKYIIRQEKHLGLSVFKGFVFGLILFAAIQSMIVSIYLLATTQGAYSPQSNTFLFPVFFIARLAVLFIGAGLGTAVLIKGYKKIDTLYGIFVKFVIVITIILVPWIDVITAFINKEAFSLIVYFGQFATKSYLGLAIPLTIAVFFSVPIGKWSGSGLILFKIITAVLSAGSALFVFKNILFFHWIDNGKDAFMWCIELIVLWVSNFIGLYKIFTDSNPEE